VCYCNAVWKSGSPQGIRRTDDAAGAFREAMRARCATTITDAIETDAPTDFSRRKRNPDLPLPPDRGLRPDNQRGRQPSSGILIVDVIILDVIIVDVIIIKDQATVQRSEQRPARHRCATRAPAAVSR
jgi:hypothetical protein